MYCVKDNAQQAHVIEMRSMCTPLLLCSYYRYVRVYVAKANGGVTLRSCRPYTYVHII